MEYPRNVILQIEKCMLFLRFFLLMVVLVVSISLRARHVKAALQCRVANTIQEHLRLIHKFSEGDVFYVCTVWSFVIIHLQINILSIL